MRTELMIFGGVIAGLVLLILLSGILFDMKVDGEVDEMLADGVVGSPEGKGSGQVGMESLPEPVKRYLRYSLGDDYETVKTVRLRHAGSFRLGEDQEWLPIAGEEYFTADRPGFIWLGKVKVNPLVWIEARDRYYQGEGSMLIKLFSTITLGDARGMEMDQSSLFRWLSETPWFPTALLPGEHLHWESINSNTALAVVEDHGIRASATFHFDDEGKITSVETTDKYMDVDGRPQPEHWTGLFREYKELNGVKIPTVGEAVWNLEGRDFSYGIFEVTEIEYDVPYRY